MTNSSPDFDGQVALVTGGVRGIGLAIVHALLDGGAKVAAGYSRNAAVAEALASDLGISVHQGNISKTEDCERVVEEVIEQHGRLDILVNNAGITVDKSVRRMTPESGGLAPTPPPLPLAGDPDAS